MERLRNRSERGSASSPAVFFILGLGLGINSVNLLHLAFDDTDSQIKKIQTENSQLTETLSEDFTQVDSLVLDRDGNFTFKTTVEQTPEVCTGKYKVGEHTVEVVGSISCAQTINPESSR